MNTRKICFLRAAVILVLPVITFALLNIMPSEKFKSEMALSRYGSTGQEVVEIQNLLKDLGFYTGEVDGIFGTGTQSAVEKFQRSKGLSVDGIVGKDTLSALRNSGAGGENNNSSKGDESVRRAQEILKDLGFYMGEVDGLNGTQTKRAVQAFQRSTGLSPDGIIGPNTLGALEAAAESVGGDNASDLELLARIISAESRGEPYNGQVAVGAVVLNRTRHPSFPSSLAGVIYQPGAFTAVVDGQFNKPVAESSRRAAQDAMNGVDTSGGAIYYYNPKTATNEWIRTRPIIKSIGSHVFCE